jgi:hypothetical protein
MKSWKTRLLMVVTALAMVLALSIPAIADDVEVDCDADDEGVCTTHVTVDSYQPEEADPGLEGVAVEDPSAVEVDEGWSPFDGLEWWPW